MTTSLKPNPDLIHSYIPALDGMRAIAILLVLIFHINESILPGGFVGVDVFFVISGFIITRNILISKASTGFSFLEFYKKRFVRLMPAALVTATLSIFIAFFIYGLERGTSLLASYLTASGWVSNIYFYLNSGYFTPISQGNPFLHFWSLSVEEQFYIFWPVLVIFFLKRSIVTYAAFLMASLIFSYLVFMRDQNAMFYMMPARIFQFAAGALIACIQLHGTARFSRNSWAAPGLLFFGGASIFTSAVFANGNGYSFALAAVLPVIGAVFLLISIHTPISQAILGNRLFVWLGKRAYSLYLVHWPLIIFTSYYIGVNRSFGVDVLIAISCLCLAACLYALVEQPLRLKNKDKANTRKFRLVMSSFILSLGIGFSAYSSKERIREIIPSKAYSFATENTKTKNSEDAIFQSLDINALLKTAHADRAHRGHIHRGCHLNKNRSFSSFNIQDCFPINPKIPKVLVIADSFGPETVPMLEKWIPSENIISASSGGCLPIYPEPNSSDRHPGCQQLNSFRYSEVRRRNDIVAVVLTTKWQKWPKAAIADTISLTSDLGKPIFIVGARPGFSENIASLLSSRRGTSIYKDLSRYLRHDVEKLNSDIRQIVDQNDHANLLDILPYFCSETCPGIFDGTEIVYLDAAHVNPIFTEYIATELEVESPSNVSLLKSLVSP